MARKVKWGKIALIGGSAGAGLWLINKYVVQPKINPDAATMAAVQSQIAAKEEPANILKTLMADPNVSSAVNTFGTKVTGQITDLLSKLGLSTTSLNI
ncbi:MAG: hypothetical protein ABIG68_10730 [Acidobacteriota bacterium]